MEWLHYIVLMHSDSNLSLLRRDRLWDVNRVLLKSSQTEL